MPTSYEQPIDHDKPRATHTPDDRKIFLGLSPGCQKWQTPEACTRWGMSLVADRIDSALLQVAQYNRNKLNFHRLRRMVIKHRSCEIILPFINTQKDYYRYFHRD